jgi:small subunit ribosomal protein S4
MIKDGGRMSSVTKSRQQVRLSRALGLALTPKARKYFDRRPYPPGEHGASKRKADSDYAIRLKEKQRLRMQYMLREKQLQAAYDYAKRLPGMTGDSMVEFLETRLDAVVLRSGFARTILQARQLVTHRHILVNGKILDKPSAQVKPGQVVMVKPKSQIMAPMKMAATGANQDALGKTPEYLDVQIEKLSTTLVRKPKYEEIPVTVDIQLVVEYYAR